MKKRMKTLLEKELELIKPTLKEQVSNILKDNFEPNCGHKIFKVLGVNIGDIVVDTLNSNFREHIIIHKVKMKARVKLNLGSGTFKESTLSLKLHNDIHLTFHKNSNQYRIINRDHFKIIDLNSN